MILSVVFIIIDILSVTPVIRIGVINPFWKFALVFKCLTDTIILDDFKTALDKLSRMRMSQILPLDAVMNGQWLSEKTCLEDHRASRFHRDDVASLEQVEDRSVRGSSQFITFPPTIRIASSR
jgi:hypothetical protein